MLDVPTPPWQDAKEAHEREMRGLQAQLRTLRTQQGAIAAEQSFAREEARVAAAQRDQALQEAAAARGQVGGLQRVLGRQHGDGGDYGVAAESCRLIVKGCWRPCWLAACLLTGRLPLLGLAH